MSEVYSNTALNIYADCANDGNAGFFRPRDTFIPLLRANWQRMPNSLWDCQIEPACIFDNHHSDRTAYLGSRGWIVQEEILSPAVAYFGQNDVFWLCHHGGASESVSVQEHGVAVDDF